MCAVLESFSVKFLLPTEMRHRHTVMTKVSHQDATSMGQGDLDFRLLSDASNNILK